MTPLPVKILTVLAGAVCSALVGWQVAIAALFLARPLV